MSSADECEYICCPKSCMYSWSTHLVWRLEHHMMMSRKVQSRVDLSGLLLTWWCHCMKGGGVIAYYSSAACLFPCCMQRWTFARRGKPCSLHVIPLHLASPVKPSPDLDKGSVQAGPAPGGTWSWTSVIRNHGKSVQSQSWSHNKRKVVKRCPFGTVGSLFVMQYHPYSP